MIQLNFEQRMELAKTPAHCPNCDSTELNMKTIPNPDNPIKSFQKRPVYYCTKCGYWTDWFDGWAWHPPEESIDSDSVGLCSWCGGSGQLEKTNHQGEYPQKYDCPVCNGTGKEPIKSDNLRGDST